MPFEIFPFLIPGVRDIIEILIVAFVLYQLLLFLAGLLGGVVGHNANTGGQ